MSDHQMLRGGLNNLSKAGPKGASSWPIKSLPMKGSIGQAAKNAVHRHGSSESRPEPGSCGASGTGA